MTLPQAFPGPRAGLGLGVGESVLNAAAADQLPAVGCL